MANADHTIRRVAQIIGEQGLDVLSELQAVLGALPPERAVKGSPGNNQPTPAGLRRFSFASCGAASKYPSTRVSVNAFTTALKHLHAAADADDEASINQPLVEWPEIASEFVDYTYSTGGTTPVWSAGVGWFACATTPRWVTMSRMGLLARLRTGAGIPLQAVPLSAIQLDYRLTIRGESHYLPQLLALKRQHERWPARLVRDRANRYDANAIAVEIDGRTVGYLAREQAEMLATQLDALSTRSCVVEFLVDLVGGDGDRPNIGVFSVD